MKIRPVGAELFYADGQTDMTKLIVDFVIFRTHLKASLLLRYRPIFDVCSEMHTSYINAHCEQSVELLNGKRDVPLATCPVLKVNAVFGDCFLFN